MTYHIYELGDANAHLGHPNHTIGAATLTAAKRAATRRQIFQGTHLVITDGEDGAVLASKADGCWIDAEVSR